MNASIFMERISNKVLAEPLIKIVDTEDIVGVVLRFHLLTELLIDSWICAKTSCAGLFGTEDDDRLLIECSNKIKMAENLGLPKEICSLVRKINKVRNDFAHRMNPDEIQKKHMSGLITLTKNLSQTIPDMDLTKEQGRFRDKNGNVICEIGIDDDTDHDKYKLLIMFYVILKAFTNNVSSTHSGKWDSYYDGFEYNMTFGGNKS